MFLTVASLSINCAVGKDSTELQLKLYGSFRGHFAAYNEEVEIQENVSRLGFEISAIRKGIRYFAGLEMHYYQPDTEIVTSRGERPIDAAFKRRYIIAGVSYHPFRLVKFYSEARIANGTAALGSKEPSVFTFGLRLDAEGFFF